MTLPTGIRGHFVAVALLVILLILLVHFAIKPLTEAYTAVGDGITAIVEDIGRYKQIIAERPELDASMVRFKEEQPLNPILLTGDNSTLAAAALQRRLQDLAVQHGARIVSVHVQPPVFDGPLERISLQARLQADSRGLRDTLYALEAGTPYIFVDSLSINVRTRRQRDSGSEGLEVRMTISGLRSNTSQGPQEAANG